MTRIGRAAALALISLWLGAGCSLVFAPDRDAIAPDPDGGTDGGVDGGMDAGVDAGFDAGPDAGDGGLDGGDACVVRQSFEISCNDGVDNDCNGLSDCSDFSCRSSGSCCSAASGQSWPLVDYDAGWVPLPSGSGPMMVSRTEVEFGTAPHPTALLLPACAPLAYGARIRIDFHIEAMGDGDEYAALVLTTADDLVAGNRLPAELALRVTDDQQAVVERAGAVVAMTEEALGASVLSATVDLKPGFDDAGRAVLRVSASIAGQLLLDDVAYMPLQDLLGSSSGCVPDGLFLAVEGVGQSVTVADATAVELFDCENPSQFLAAQARHDLANLEDHLPAGDWRRGGAGEPSVVYIPTSPASPTARRLEIWADGSFEERTEEIFRPLSFAIGGAFHAVGTWQERTTMLGPGPSSREPSLAVVLDDDGFWADSQLHVAWASDADGDERFDIQLASIGANAAAPIGATTTVLTAGSEGCESFRDPSVAALGATLNDGLLMFFTCEGGTDSIGGARLSYEPGSGSFTVTDLETALLSSAVGGYGQRGVFSPEAVVRPASDGHSVRVWFLARNSSGDVRLGFAQAELGVDQRLPSLVPYAGNPVLGPSDPELGADDCSLGCELEASSAAVIAAEGTRFTEDAYLLLVHRSRNVPTGVVHDLVPLLQARPLEP